MRDPHSDQGAADAAGPSLRSHDRTAAHHFRSPVCPGFPGQNQCQFEVSTGLGPIFRLKQHPRATDVPGGACAPVAVTVRSITQRDLKFEALGPVPVTQTKNASRV